jgi:hypothetical protein
MLAHAANASSLSFSVVFQVFVFFREAEEKVVHCLHLLFDAGQVFISLRKAAEPTSPLVYQEMCLRATLKPVSGP